MQSWGFPKLEEFNTFDNIHAGDIFSNFREQIKLSPHIYCFNLALDIISIWEPIFRALDYKTRRGLLGHHNSIKEASKTW